MVSDFINSLFNSLRTLEYLRKPWVLKYLLFSGIISIIIYIISIYSIFEYGDNLGQYILSKFVDDDTYSWLVTTVGWLVRIVLITGFVFIFKYIVIIVTSPFMSALSEEIEIRLTDRERIKQTLGIQMKSMVRGIRLSSGNLARELLIVVLLILVGLLPIVGLVSPIIIFAVQAYFAGFGNIDFYMERHFNLSESKRFIKLNKGMAIGNGTVFLLLFLIPFIGAFFAPTICTISGTLSVLDKS